MIGSENVLSVHCVCFVNKILADVRILFNQWIYIFILRWVPKGSILTLAKIIVLMWLSLKVSKTPVAMKTDNGYSENILMHFNACVFASTSKVIKLKKMSLQDVHDPDRTWRAVVHGDCYITDTDCKICKCDY